MLARTALFTSVTAALATLALHDAPRAAPTAPVGHTQHADPAQALIDACVYPDHWASFTPAQQAFLRSIAANVNAWHPSTVALCYAPGTDPRYIDAIDALQHAAATQSDDNTFIHQTNGWNTTASDPSHIEGQPLILTFGFPPDGTPIGALSSGFQNGTNNLNAFLNNIFGSKDAWLPIFQGVFNRWANNTGLAYRYEPNDDGSKTGSFQITGGGPPRAGDNPGILGSRADIRIAGMNLDGPNGVLAFNYFPDNGDMVIDTGDTNLYSDPANNYRLFRNIIAHEHGHGMGLFHVCPLSQTRLMEPFLAINFDGPQHDDFRGAQYLYGDANESNNTTPDATPLGTLPPDTLTTFGTLQSPFIPNSSTLSIDHPSENDFYSVSVDAPGSLVITVNPVGQTYTDAPQDCNDPNNANCCTTGIFTDSTAQQDLAIDLFDADNNMLLDTADLTPAGSPETISLDTSAASSFHLQVRGSGAGEETQMYQLVLLFTPLPPELSPCDTDQNELVDFFDLLAYLDLWFAQDSAANFNTDETTDFFDLLDYLDCWFTAG